LLLAACSERDPGILPAQTPATSARMQPSFETRSLQKISSKVAAGGIPTSYDAYFDQQQLKGIIEERSSATTEQGEYIYTGARLMQYTGSALPASAHTAGIIELKFDLQGRLQSARTTSNDSAPSIEQQQIDAIRTRALLLRSHALARRSINAHRQTGPEHG
jgi:hypothetical protein